MRLLLDEMLSPRIAKALRAEGHDVVAAAEEVALRGLADDLLLERATRDERVLVTRNVADFARLHQLWHTEGKSHQGIAMVTSSAFPQDRSFVGALTASLCASDELLSDAARGAIIFVRNTNVRDS
ncbi:MAG: DUF5615 family PIN-like protein [Frankiaceae bacterium]|nr:DUF5615 family PIN-like protein [Frankiaceae bacterium]MBV9369348.1 DUF5615 family PIN-like protein [Frankiales bacterium]